MSTYEPGTVAMVTALNRRKEYRAYFDGKTWREHGCSAFCVDTPTSIRPLVVLDLGPGSIPARDAVRMLRTVTNIDGEWPSLRNWLADQIEAQTKPPRRFKLGEFVHYVDTGNDNEAWARRRDDQHVGIVIRVYPNSDVVKVWDTVDNDWWQAEHKHLAAVEDGAK